jgi:hypothetical protein
MALGASLRRAESAFDFGFRVAPRRRQNRHLRARRVFEIVEVELIETDRLRRGGVRHHAMANLQVKDVPEDVHRRLRECARRRGKSLRELVLERKVKNCPTTRSRGGFKAGPECVSLALLGGLGLLLMATIGLIVEGIYDEAVYPILLSRCRCGVSPLTRVCKGPVIGKLQSLVGEFERFRRPIS